MLIFSRAKLRIRERKSKWKLFYLLFPSVSNLERSSELRISDRKSKWKEQKNGGGGCGFEFWLLSFYPLSNIRRQKSSAIQKISGVSLNNTSRISFFPCGYRHSIYNITYHTSQRPPFPSKVNETWAESQPFQYGLGDCHPTQNANPQTLPSLECLRIVLYCAKRMRPGA